MRLACALVVLAGAVLLVTPLSIRVGAVADSIPVHALTLYGVTASAYGLLPFVRRGDILVVAIWVVLGVGPGKPSRQAETESPVEKTLAAKDAQLINVNLLRYFSDPTALDDAAKALFSRAIRDAAASIAAGTLRPHVSDTIPCELDAVNAALADMKAGRKSLGKIAVIVDKERTR